MFAVPLSKRTCTQAHTNMHATHTHTHTPERNSIVLLSLSLMIAVPDQKGAIHPHSLQHVFRLLASEFLVEPRLAEVTVLLGHGESQYLLECGALEWVGLCRRNQGGRMDGERE